MKPTPSQPNAWKRWEECRTHVWQGRALARCLLEMAWGCAKDAHSDDCMRVMFIQAEDLRMTLEVLVTELLKAEELLGGLENHICDEYEEGTSSAETPQCR